jgi:hypothetical protein
MSVVLSYGCKNWSLILREEYRECLRTEYLERYLELKGESKRKVEKIA